MATEELFLRQIDSLDGGLEVIAEPGLPYTAVSAGAFVMRIDHEDRDAVINLVAMMMADPERECPALMLVGGDELHIGATVETASAEPEPARCMWISCGPVHMRLHFGTASLLVAALSEARHWHRNRLMIEQARQEAGTC